jgi:hypothetical protein
MLVNLYNSKDQSVYENHYISILDKLNWYKVNTVDNSFFLSSQRLQDLFVTRIKEIIRTVKRKLVEDCRKK